MHTALLVLLLIELRKQLNLEIAVQARPQHSSVLGGKPSCFSLSRQKSKVIFSVGENMIVFREEKQLTLLRVWLNCESSKQRI